MVRFLVMEYIAEPPHIDGLAAGFADVEVFALVARFAAVAF